MTQRVFINQFTGELRDHLSLREILSNLQDDLHLSNATWIEKLQWMIIDLSWKRETVPCDVEVYL